MLCYVYLGDCKSSSDEDDCERYPYALKINNKYTIHPGSGGNCLLLGSHKMNDINYKKVKQGERLVGRPQTNNAHFEKILIKATRRINIGEEIFIDYESSTNI